MNTPEPKPKRSRRMVLWLVAMPIAILLLALAGANWKFFHLAYAKHLMRSDDPKKQGRGVQMVAETHLRKGMTRDEIQRLLSPARVEDGLVSGEFLSSAGFTVDAVLVLPVIIEGTPPLPVGWLIFMHFENDKAIYSFFLPEPDLVGEGGQVIS